MFDKDLLDALSPDNIFLVELLLASGYSDTSLSKVCSAVADQRELHALLRFTARHWQKPVE